MEIRPTGLDNVVEAVPSRHGDSRGWFSETWNRKRWEEAGYDIDWVQDNESLSAVAGTVRGVHFQREPFAQNKLVRVLSGRILDVAVDLRRSSPTFGTHVAVELSAAAGNQLLIPVGFGHAFATLEHNCHIAYKVSAPYSPEYDAALAWNDPALGIDWGLGERGITEAVVSIKDQAAPRLADADGLLFD